eukprot:TRINITY_DN3936_c0_g1_i2.p1 TRINITY_DN3936_c0_g1~~TRINITY_DN3936_c0_g1_i2.p1  ORF type:complete len:293 (-),score=30.19 TRINITY_DN3936_c0_g1_i2:57-881(-)
MAEHFDPPTKRRKIEVVPEKKENVEVPDPPEPKVRLLAGDGSKGTLVLGNALESRFGRIVSLSAGADGAVYIADDEGGAICCLKDGVVSRYAGVDADAAEPTGPVNHRLQVRLRSPLSVVVGPNGTYVSDYENGRIYVVVGDKIADIAGSLPHPQPTFTEPAPAQWGLANPVGMAITRNGSIFVLEFTDPSRIRKVENGVISYVADPSYPGWPGPSYQPQVIVASHDDSRLLFSDSGDHSIWQLPLAGGPITRVETYLPPGSSANLEFVCDAGA